MEEAKEEREHETVFRLGATPKRGSTPDRFFLSSGNASQHLTPVRLLSSDTCVFSPSRTVLGYSLV